MTKIYCITAILLFFSCNIVVFAQRNPPTNAVGQQTFSFEDLTRNRKLITELWYPTTEKPTDADTSPFIRIPTVRNAAISTGSFPLILFSHGTGGGRLTVEWFCAGLAARGFMVAAVDHFGNTFDNPIPEQFVKFWERPQDLTFVLDRLIAEKNISPFIDTSRVGVAGFSLGGYTAIALSGGKADFQALRKYFMTENGKKEADIPEMPGLLSYFEKPAIFEDFKKAPELQDIRIKSAFVMSPALGQAFPVKESVNKITIPVYIVGAGNDQIAPLKTNAAHYATLIHGSRYTVVGGPSAGHYVFLNEAKQSLKDEVPLIFNDAPGVSRNATHQQTLQLALDHFVKTLHH